jgi:glycerol uptake facilitator-like aquaporin
MFDLTLVQLSQKARSGGAQALAEWVATFGLVTTILLTLKARPKAVAMSVGLYITAAYWFTASTSFANPAVTLARAFSDTFAGIRLADVPLFVTAQIIGAICAYAFVCQLTAESQDATLAASPTRIGTRGDAHVAAAERPVAELSCPGTGV